MLQRMVNLLLSRMSFRYSAYKTDRNKCHRVSMTTLLLQMASSDMHLHCVSRYDLQ